MDAVNITFIHPTNSSELNLNISKGTLLIEVFLQLIEAGFLASGGLYAGVIVKGEREYSEPLDNDKTLGENGVENNDIVLIIISCISGAALCHAGLWWLGCSDMEEEYILKRQVWDTFDLATKINKSELFARNLLEAFGYKRHDKTGLFIQTEHTGTIAAARPINLYLARGYNAKDMQHALQEQWWNYHELAMALNKSDKTAMCLLDFLGYRFHNKLDIFSKTEKSDRIASILQDLNYNLL